MPDLTIEHYRWCQANEQWGAQVEGSKGNLYNVLFNRGVWYCSCPDHVHRGRECKHIRAVQADKCDYGWEAACGSPSEFSRNADGEYTCPKCGGPTSVVRVAI